MTPVYRIVCRVEKQVKHLAAFQVPGEALPGRQSIAKVFFAIAYLGGAD